MILAHLRLPPRSAEALGLAVQGFHDKEIGERLQKMGKPLERVTARTVRDHLRPCLKRLHTARKSRLAYETFALFRRLQKNF